VNEPSDKKVKLIILGVVVVLAAGVWGYTLLGSGESKPPPPSPKVDALKAGYDKVEKQAPVVNEQAPAQPSKGAHKAQ
jgi:hypothetical protein